VTNIHCYNSWSGKPVKMVLSPNTWRWTHVNNQLHCVPIQCITQHYKDWFPWCSMAEIFKRL